MDYVLYIFLKSISSATLHNITSKTQEATLRSGGGGGVRGLNRPYCDRGEKLLLMAVSGRKGKAIFDLHRVTLDRVVSKSSAVAPRVYIWETIEARTNTRTHMYVML